MTQVFITRRIFQAAIDLLDQAALNYTHNAADQPLTPEQIKAQASDAAALVCLLTDKIDAELMDGLPHLKVVANVAVGYDNIDVATASERGIVVTNTPDVLTECTADLAFALILGVARRLVEADNYMRRGEFDGWELFQPHLGADVYGKTLGIVGMGRIGTAVARRGALGFGMKVIYTNSSQRSEMERELGAQRVGFDDLLRQSDFISIHVPLNTETHHLFTLDEFRQMKSTAFLINTARGPIIREQDLVVALESGLISGAGLDVFEEEPKMHPGLVNQTSHVVLLPHIGSASEETRQRMATTAVSNVIAGLQGSCPPNALNPDVWPR